MLRAFLLCLGISLFTWLGFEFFPGHTYLQSDTQIYLPILERLDTPGYLSRDAIATHPHVTYTIYDEVTLFLHATGRIDFKAALIGQQLLFRAAGMLGCFLIVQATGVGALFAFLAAAMVNLGAALLGPAILLVEYEPVPRAFAACLIFLAIGLIVHARPLAAGVAATLAFLYHPPTSGPFWAVIILGFIFDPGLRKQWRPAFTVLIIGILLLANLAQLQPGVVEPQMLFGKVSERLAELQHYRTRYSWVSLWAPSDIWHYLALTVLAGWAMARIWKRLNRPLRWFFLVLPVLGVVSIPLSYLLLERMRLAIIPALQPARALLYTVLVATLASCTAGLFAAKAGRRPEACLWFSVVIALPMRVRILDLLRVDDLTSLIQLVLCGSLALLLAFLAARYGNTRWRAAVLAVPLFCIAAMPSIGRVQNFPRIDNGPILELAEWAKNNTWGSSMFLFPDAGHELYPGAFRGQSRRALWVDWKSGGQVNYFESFAREWWDRWEQTMDGPLTTARLQGMLPLPIDYYVLKKAHTLNGVKPVFVNRQFVVYDARDLRNSSTSLRVGIDD